MKKFLAAVTAILMLMSLVTVPLFAEEQPPQPVVFAVTSAEVKPGDSVEVTVSIAGAYKAHGLILNLSYDDKLLTIEETDGENDDGDPIKVPWIDDGDALKAIGETGATYLVEAKDDPAFVALGVMAPKRVFKAEGDLFTVHFKVAEDAEVGTKIALDVEVTEFVYMPRGEEGATEQPPAEPIPCEANDGELTVVGEPGEPEATPVPEDPGEPTPEPGDEPVIPPKTGVISFVGLGIAAILSGAGVVLFRRKK